MADSSGCTAREEERRKSGSDGREMKRKERDARAESAGTREGDERGDGARGGRGERVHGPDPTGDGVPRALRQEAFPQCPPLTTVDTSRDGDPLSLWGEKLSLTPTPCPLVPAGAGAAERPELRIVLLGRSGAGRSATGNTLLSREQFVSQLSSQPVTTTCTEGGREWGEWRVAVMDTPAIFGGSSWDKKKLTEERKRCLDFAARKPCVLLLVTQLGRYTREDREVQKGVRKVFGDATEHMMVVFTRREDLEDDSLDTYVRTAENGALKKLVDACGEQYCAVGNREPRPERDVQADAVLRRALHVATRPHREPRSMSNFLCFCKGD
ncbi:GTPase IMAP family member 1-like [Cyrtonyx montezumae]|uniref:GTPase IMAP family member 1-like n=1 Tax=Cyrtonyx montezumae TaxID=9017 RepID=UPI0032DB703D